MAKAAASRGRGLVKGEGAWRSFMVRPGGAAAVLPDMELSLSDSDSEEEVIGGSESAWGTSDMLFLRTGRKRRPGPLMAVSESSLAGDSTTTGLSQPTLTPAEQVRERRSWST